MINRSIRGLLLLLAVVLGYSASVQAQIKTTTFNNNTVKENSIVVKYSDEAITVKGKAFSPKQMAATLRTELNANIGRSIKAQNVEEWLISGDMQSAITRLNRIPGVRAFPNYVFYRDEMEVLPLPNGGISNQLSDENAIARENINLPDQSFVITPAQLNTFNPINVVWEDNLDDSLRVDSTYTIVDYYGGSTEQNWMITDDMMGGYQFKAANNADSLTNISSDLFFPALDMSGLDSTKSYRLKFDLNNYFNSGAYIALYAIVNGDYVGDFVISNFDQFVWWDVSAFVGDTVTFNIWVDGVDVSPGGIVAIDNIEIEEYPTDDSLIELQYGLYNDGLFNPGYSVAGADVDAFGAWEMTTGSDDVIMVVYDDGVDFSHPDLFDNRWVNPGEDLNGDGMISEDEWNGIDDDGNGYPDDFWGWSSIYNDNSFINPGSFHGTHVAGILGAQGNNGMGISGVAQDVSIINVMIFDEFGGTDAIAIMAGYQYISSLLDSGVDITGINQSWGGGGFLDLESDQQFVSVMTSYALDHAEHAALWVVSAGNDASNRDELPFYSYPNNIQAPNIITVASSDDADNLSGFSDFGVFTVDVSAPGSQIVSTLPPSTTGVAYGYLSGTSMASPHVSGILALAKAMYPNEDGFDLMTRVLAGNEAVGSLDGYTGAGGRVNAMGALDPTTVGASTPIASGNTNQFHRTFVDGDAMETAGIVNTSDSDITIQSMEITGDNADAFYLITDELPTLAAGEAFGILVGFDNGDMTGDLTATLEVTTTNGTVNLAMIGHEQGFAFVDVSPGYYSFGSVPYGEELETTFTVSNLGNADMFYNLQHALFFYDLEQSMFVDSKVEFQPGPAPANKVGDNNEMELINDITTKVMLERGDSERPVIKAEPRDPQAFDLAGPEYLWFDDLNSDSAVAADWEILDFSEGEGDNWELVDISGDGSNNVFLFGDFIEGYANNSATVAATPMFDFSGFEAGRGPAYLHFDVDIALEDFWDEFFLNIVVDGQPYAYIGGTNTGEIVNYNGYYTVFVDISQFAGFENVEFWFIAVSDISFSGGFGVLFDNVGVVVDDYPFFTSVNGGVIAPGESENVDLTIRTELLPPGDFVMFTDVFANGFISYYGNGGDASGLITEFSARNVALEVDPMELWLGEVSTEEPTSYSFDLTNVGTVGVDYFANTMVFWEQPDDFLNDNMLAARESATTRFENSDKGEGSGIDLVKQRNVILSNAEKRSNARAEVRTVERPRMTPSLESLDIYFEDFESGMLSEDWSVFDGSFGLGNVFEVENFGTVDNPFHMLDVGGLSQNGYYILNDTYTLAFSPTFDLSDVPFSENVIMEMTYSVLMEAGWDFASVWVGVETDAGSELYYLGSSEDALINNGGFYRTGFDLSGFAGQENVFVAFLVETDASVQSTWASFDDIDIYTAEKLSYVEPAEGFIDSAGTQTLDVTVNTPWLFPGNYASVTFIDYYNEDLFVGRFAEQVAYFMIPNMKPVAEDDFTAVLSGTIIDLEFDMIGFILSNDYDVDGPVYLYDVEEPYYGAIKYSLDGPVYVAPHNFDGVDFFRYIITDGQLTDTATVYISVANNPHFPTGSDQQYVFLEDEDLTLSTVRMAAGVGGQDADLFVWANPMHESVMINHDSDNHTVTFSAADNFFGQTEAMFYVGHEGEPMDSMMVSIVITPVNDAPVAEFSANIDGSTVTFADMSSDAIDMQAGGIVAWEWNFGDGTTSTDQNPTYDYGTTGDFTVTLKVTDNGGLTDTFEGNVNIMSVSNEVNGAVPTEFAIAQNYPNPFNPSTNINYSLPEASKVSIVVYDMLGQRVAQLVNAEKSAGYHTVTFDASALSSGMYVYQIKAGSFSQTKKMMLIK